MEVEVTGRHVEVTRPMTEHIQRRAARLPRFDDRIHYLRVTLNMESDVQHVEIVARCHRSDIVAEARSHDMYQSIEAAFDKTERQIARLHDKLVSKSLRAAQRASQRNRRAK